MADESKLIASIPRTATEQIQVAINEFKGKKYLDLRVFYTTDAGGSWLPTKKGVTVAPDNIDLLIEAIQNAKGEFEIEE
jgi:hypothetical protein